MLLWKQNLLVLFYIPILYFCDKVLFRKCHHTIRINIWKFFLIRICIPIQSPFIISIDKKKESMIKNSLILKNTNLRTAENLESLFLSITISITIFLLIFYFALYFKSIKELSQSLPLRNIEAENMIKNILTKPCPILYTEKINTPLTYGIVNSKIVIPKEFVQKEKILNLYVICHECMHIKKHDNLWKFFAGAIVCVYWCNPFIWFVYFYFEKKLEFCCDENVLNFFDDTIDKRKQYAENLLFYAAMQSGITLFQSSYAKKQVKERIIEIMKFKKYKKSVISICAILLLCVGMFAISFQVEAQENKAMKNVEFIEESLSDDSLQNEEVTNTKTSKFNITDENLDEKVEALERNELSEEEGKAVEDAFHDRNRRIIAEWEKKHQ